MDALLFQFSISHYCEKARWALDFKGIDYRVSNLLPGLHIKPLRRLVADTTVPVLQMHGQAVQGSDQIIDFLDAQIETNALTPETPHAQQAACEWEKFVAVQIADPLRSCFYHYMLQHPRLVIDLFTNGGPWYGKMFYTFTFRRVEQRIRAAYQINQRSALLCMRAVGKAIKRLAEHLEGRQFLVDERFSRADLSACALLSPLVMPERGYMKQGMFMPEEIVNFRKQYLDNTVFRWVNDLYNQYR